MFGSRAVGSQSENGQLGRSINSGHMPIEAELERMVITGGLFMEVVSTIIQHPLNALYPVVKDEFQFRPLNFIQKYLNASEKILRPGKLLSYKCRLHVTETPEVRRCQVRTVERMGYSSNIIFSEKVLRGL
jgi:hypothetical protein